MNEKTQFRVYDPIAGDYAEKNDCYYLNQKGELLYFDNLTGDFYPVEKHFRVEKSKGIIDINNKLLFENDIVFAFGFQILKSDKPNVMPDRKRGRFKFRIEWNNEYCSLNFVALLPGTYINADPKQRNYELCGNFNEK